VALPGSPDARAADFDKVNKPENDVKLIQLATDAA
jgi:hypothetical protein